MIEDYVPIVIGVVSVATFILQLCTGVAFSGWLGHNSIVDREENPGQFWFVMALQSIAGIVVVLVFFYQ